MKKERKTVLPNPPITEVENLSSATECTGLFPSAVTNSNEAEHYARLYAIHQQKVDTSALGPEKKP